MSTPHLVHEFYDRIWHAGDRAAVGELLADDFVFRGSLGTERIGHDRFWEYVCEVRSALDQYRCDVVDCVAEERRAFARMRFGGVHVGAFRGFLPSGLPVHWSGAALFQFADARIGELWVLGDLAGLDALLRLNASDRSGTR